MKKLSKIVLLSCSLFLLASLVGCSNGSSDSDNDSETIMAGSAEKNSLPDTLLAGAYYSSSEENYLFEFNEDGKTYTASYYQRFSDNYTGDWYEVSSGNYIANENYVILTDSETQKEWKKLEIKKYNSTGTVEAITFTGDKYDSDSDLQRLHWHWRFIR